MSIGPTREEKFQLSTLDRIRSSVKKAVDAYFSDPIHYIFFAFLIATMVGLFVGMAFSWQYFVFLGGLGLGEGIKFYLNYEPKGKDTK